MHPEIENLINMALADGDVTDKERGIILRKAESLGEDKDEVEMILDGKIALMKKEQSTSQLPTTKSNKEGEIKKCPACGASVPSFEIKCKDCGQEFRGISAEKTISDLFILLQQINTQNRWTSQKVEQSVVVISNFPLPNSKETILEFVAQAFPKARGHGNAFANFMNEGHFDMQLRKAWRHKFEEAVIKCRILFKDESVVLKQVETYAAQIGFK